MLYLGCNVLRTSHMVQTATAIFDRLGLDYTLRDVAARVAAGGWRIGNVDVVNSTISGNTSIVRPLSDVPSK